ncbi:acyl-CoA dehydrogenase family protein [Sphingomonas sp. YL-JM2C]
MDDSGIGLDELREAIRQVLDERLQTQGDAIPDEDGRPLDRDLWRQMAGLGWLALGVAEEHGGLGQGFAHAAVLHEELGRALASVPSLTTLLAADAIALAGSAEQKARWLPAIAAGELMAGIALPPPGGAPAPVQADGLIVRDMPFADAVDLFLLPVAAADGGVALALVEAAGASVTRRRTVDLTRSMGEVRVDAATLAAADRIALDPAMLDRLRDRAAVALASDAIGGAAAVLERTVDYLCVREQFGRPIGSFQALKHRAASWKVLLEAATALVRHAADAVGTGEADASVLASSAKYYACDVYAATAADAIQLHGGIGFTWEHACHLFLKRAKLNQLLFGSSSLHKDRVAGLAFTSFAPDATAPEPTV